VILLVGAGADRGAVTVDRREARTGRPRDCPVPGCQPPPPSGRPLCL